MLENLMGALATLWLQSGFVAACGLVMSSFVQKRSATLAATVLRATWLGVALCLILSATSFGSLASRRALWNVALPTVSVQTASAPRTSVQTVAAPTIAAPTISASTTAVPTPEAFIGSLPSTLPQITPSATEPDFPDASAPSSTRSSTEADDVALVQTPAPSSVATTSVAASSIATTSPRKPLSILNVLLTSWLVGSAVLLLWTSFCAWQMRRVVHSSTRIDDGVWRDELRELCALLQVRQPLLLRSDLARSPFLTGLFRPCIVLPRGDFGTSQRFVLLHELTHLQRRDLWWNAASRVLCAVLWTQPLLWMLQRRSEQIGEEVCDEAVVSRGESARQYAQCLLDLAGSWRPTRGERIIGAGVVPLRSGLARRVQNILDESRRRTMIVSHRARWVIGVSMLGIVGLSLSLVAVQANPTVSAQSSTRLRDLSSPESAVRSFASALNAKDLDEAARYVEGGAPLVNLDLQAQINKAKFSIAVGDFKTKISGATALVTFGETKTDFGNRNGNPNIKVRRTTLSLRQSNGAWKITSAILGHPGPDASLLQEATEVLSPRFKTRLTAWAKNRGRASIVGRMLDDNGRPVPNARIHVTMISEDVLRQFDGRNTVYQAEMMNIAPQVRALFNQYVQTKADGTFRVNGLTSALYDLSPLPIPERRMPRLIPTGSLHVAAREGSSTRSVNLKMLTGIPLSARVVENATRKPLPGVEVTLNMNLTRDKRGKQHVFFISGKTDANGRASLVSIQGRSHVMLVSKEVKRLNGLYIVSNGVPYLPLPKAGDKAPRPLNSTYATGQTVLINRDKIEVVFALQRYVAPKTASTSGIRSWNEKAAPIRGRVVDANGRPVAGARVMLQATNEAANSKEYQAWRRLREKAMLRVLAQGRIATTYPATPQLFEVWTKFGFADTTRADGTYRLSGLELTQFNVLVVPIPEINTHHLKNGWFLLSNVATAAQIRTPLARTTELVNDIVLTRGAIIQGRVLDSTTGQPLPRVFVACHGPQNPRSGAAVTTCYTDAQGRYVMRVAPGTSYVYMGGAQQIKARVHFEDSTPYVKDLIVIKNDKNLYHPYSWMQVQLDNAAPRLARTSGAGFIKVPTTLGQTRTLDFRLNKLVVKRKGNVPDVYIAGKPNQNAYSSDKPNRSASYISGRVVYADGRPAAGVRMGVWFQPEAARSNELSAWAQPMADAVERLLTKEGGKLTARQTLNKIFDIRRKFGEADITRADGTYRLSVMASTRFNVLVDTYDEIYVNRPPYILPDWVEAGASPTGIAPKAGVTTQIADVVLTRGAIIRGRVLDRVTGRPLPNVFITCHRPLNQPSGVAATSARTDAQGRYAMRVAPSARYVYIGGNGYMGGTYIGVKHLTATVHSEDLPPYVKELNLIKIGSDLYNPNAWMQVQLDNAAPRWTQAGSETRHFEIPTRLGQTRTLNFRLDKLVVKRKGRAVDVYIPGKPRP